MSARVLDLAAARGPAYSLSTPAVLLEAGQSVLLAAISASSASVVKVPHLTLAWLGHSTLGQPTVLIRSLPSVYVGLWIGLVEGPPLCNFGLKLPVTAGGVPWPDFVAQPGELVSIALVNNYSHASITASVTGTMFVTTD